MIYICVIDRLSLHVVGIKSHTKQIGGTRKKNLRNMRVEEPTDMRPLKLQPFVAHIFSSASPSKCLQSMLKEMGWILDITLLGDKTLLGAEHQSF